MKIAWLSDFDLTGSGYLNISVPLCSGLASLGHEIKCIGLGYKGSEHNYNFSIIPTVSPQDGLHIIQNLYTAWGFDVMVVALDMPLQEVILNSLNDFPFKYIGITPLEAPPLCTAWAASLLKATNMFVITKFGVEEFSKCGISASYLPVGIDLEAWKPAKDAGEKSLVRAQLGFDENAFIVLTVADNQERKNLSAGMEIFRQFNINNPNSLYIVVTRQNQYIGWKLLELASEMKIASKYVPFERGLSQEDLHALYVCSDVFLLPSKAEGFGMPILEAMATNLLCVGTDCTSIREHLSEERGVLIPYAYKYRDPFGNQWRYFIDTDAGARALLDISNNKSNYAHMVDNAYKYVTARKWEEAVNLLHNTLQSYEVEQKHD